MFLKTSPHRKRQGENKYVTRDVCLEDNYHIDFNSKSPAVATVRKPKKHVERQHFTPEVRLTSRPQIKSILIQSIPFVTKTLPKKNAYIVHGVTI